MCRIQDELDFGQSTDSARIVQAVIVILSRMLQAYLAIVIDSSPFVELALWLHATVMTADDCLSSFVPMERQVADSELGNGKGIQEEAVPLPAETLPFSGLVEHSRIALFWVKQSNMLDSESELVLEPVLEQPHAPVVAEVTDCEVLPAVAAEIGTACTIVHEVGQLTWELSQSNHFRQRLQQDS